MLVKIDVSRREVDLRVFEWGEVDIAEVVALLVLLKAEQPLVHSDLLEVGQHDVELVFSEFNLPHLVLFTWRQFNLAQRLNKFEVCLISGWVFFLILSWGFVLMLVLRIGCDITKTLTLGSWRYQHNDNNRLVVNLIEQSLL